MVIDLQHIGVAHPGHGLNLSSETLQSGFDLLIIDFQRSQPVLGYHFNGDVMLEVQLMRTIYFTKGALAD